MPEPTYLIYCAGNQGRVVLDILSRGQFEGNVAFIDDEQEPGTMINGTEVIGDYQRLKQFNPSTDKCIVAYGDKQTVRLTLVRRIKELDFGFFSAIDSDTTISETAVIGNGVTINSRSYIGPNARIGPHTLVDSCVNISHGAVLKRGVTLAPNITLAGEVSVGEDVYIGAGAVVIDGVSIGDGAVVGAGAVVLDDVPNDTTVVGVPASEISR